MLNPNQPESSIMLEELFYIPLGEHNPFYSRPLTMNLSQNAVDGIVNNMSQSGRTSLNISDVSHYAGEIMQPHSKPLETMITNNWLSQRRYIFILKVSCVQLGGLIDRKFYIQGFTDYDGVNEHTGNADMAMVHNINTIIETVWTEVNTPTGVIGTERLSRIYDALSMNKSDSSRSSSWGVHTHRPFDVYENIQMAEQISQLGSIGSNIVGLNAGSIITEHGGTVNTAKRANLIPSNYITNVLNGSLEILNREDAQSFTMSNVHAGGVFDDQDMWGGSGAMTFGSVTRETPLCLIEDPLDRNDFVRQLSRMKFGRMSGYADQFTLGDLELFGQNISNRFVLLKLNKNMINPTLANSPTVGEYWHGNDPVTLKAYTLIESMAAMVTKYGFSRIYMTATNMAGPTMEFVTTVTDFRGFINLDQMSTTRLLDMLRNLTVVEILIPETAGSTIPIYCEFIIDILGTSKVYLEYAGFPGTWYTAPSSLSSIGSSLVSTDGDLLMHNAGMVGTLSSAIRDVVETTPGVIMPNHY